MGHFVLGDRLSVARARGRLCSAAKSNTGPPLRRNSTSRGIKEIKGDKGVEMEWKGGLELEGSGIGK